MTETRAGWEALEHFATATLSELKQKSRHRTLTPQVPELASALVAGHIDLTHNDYLGLRVMPKFLERARSSIVYLAPGAGASRLLGGEHPIFSQLEEAFAAFKGAAAALYFSSGYAANEALVTCLAESPACCFFSDELNHASIIDGFKLSRLPKLRRQVYRHCDLDHLEQLLKQSTSPTNIVYTESVFSMDGDVAPLATIQDLCQRYRGVLVVDEAHAVGVYGASGSGMIEEQLGSHDQIISINTCGKALGCQGALVAGPPWLRDLLINRARSFIYSTAPSPWLAAALLEAIAIVQSMTEARQNLHERSQAFREQLQLAGIDCGLSQTQIVPVITGSEQNALRIQRYLEENGVLACAIRPPTVAENACRVRLSLNSNLTSAHYDKITATISEALQNE